MRYLSLFSGVEAASVAWGPLGWTPVAFAEIEPFPCSLLADGPRYRALGNSMAVPVIAWIGRQIVSAQSGAHDA